MATLDAMNKLFWLLIVLAACTVAAKKETVAHVKYFPDSLDSDTTFKTFLIRGGEPSLFERNDSAETFRITFVSTALFIPDKVIRFEKNANDTLFHIFGVTFPKISLINKSEFNMTMQTTQ